MSYIVSLWYLHKLILCWIEMPINIRSLIKWWLRFGVIDGSWFFSAWILYHICRVTNSFYRRVMHNEDERPRNEKSHAYHFSITYNGCDFCLLTPSAILALSKCLFKGWRLKFRGFSCLRSCSRHCNRGVSHYPILPISRDIGCSVQQLDYFRYKATYILAVDLTL